MTDELLRPQVVGVGRNLTTVVQDELGTRVRKSLVGDADDVARRFANLLDWDRVMSKRQQVSSPRIIAAYPESFVIEHEWVPNRGSIQDLLAGGPSRELNEALATAAAMLARLHSETWDDQIHHNLGPASGVSPLIALTVSQYAQASGAELECWAMLQHDDELRHGMERLSEGLASDRSHLGPRHGDVRPDQFLLDEEGGLSLIDFEEFGWGPTIPDLAALIGSVLFDAMSRTFGSAIDVGEDVLSIHEGFIARGERALQAAQPGLRAIVDSYTSNSKHQIDTALLFAGAGWFMIERVTARAKFSYRLPAGDRAIAGIGRQAIIDPELGSGLLSNEPR